MHQILFLKVIGYKSEKKLYFKSKKENLTLIVNKRVHLMSPGNSICLFRDKIWSINLITYYYYSLSKVHLKNVFSSI